MKTNKLKLELKLKLLVAVRIALEFETQCTKRDQNGCINIVDLLHTLEWTQFSQGSVHKYFFGRHVLPRFSDVGSPKLIFCLEIMVLGTNFH